MTAFVLQKGSFQGFIDYIRDADTFITYLRRGDDLIKIICAMSDVFDTDVQALLKGYLQHNLDVQIVRNAVSNVVEVILEINTDGKKVILNKLKQTKPTRVA